MMKLNDITVLMSACGSPSIPGMIRCLKENGERNIRVVGVDMDDDRRLLCLYALQPYGSAIAATIKRRTARSRRYAIRLLKLPQRFGRDRVYADPDGAAKKADGDPQGDHWACAVCGWHRTFRNW